jgi:hypothetical protein
MKYNRIKYPPQEKTFNGVKYLSLQVYSNTKKDAQKDALFYRDKNWNVRVVKFKYDNTTSKYALYARKKKKRA